MLSYFCTKWSEEALLEKMNKYRMMNEKPMVIVKKDDEAKL